MLAHKGPYHPSVIAQRNRRYVSRRNGNKVFVGDMREYENQKAAVSKRWWEYTQCASNRISKNKNFYHPKGEAFHPLARSTNVGADDCGYAYNLWLKAIANVNALADKLQDPEYPKLQPDRYYWSDQKTSDIETESQVYAQMADQGATTTKYLDPLTEGFAPTSQEDTSLEGGEEEEGTGPGLGLILGVGGLVLLVVGGGGYLFYKRRKARMAAEEEE